MTGRCVFLACLLCLGVWCSAGLVQAGGNAWEFHFPSPNRTLPRTNIHGTGNVPIGYTYGIKYRIVHPNGVTNDEVDGLSYDNGSWYLIIAGPATAATNQRAELVNDGAVKVSVSPLTVQ